MCCLKYGHASCVSDKQFLNVSRDIADIVEKLGEQRRHSLSVEHFGGMFYTQFEALFVVEKHILIVQDSLNILQQVCLMIRYLMILFFTFAYLTSV